MRKVRTRLAWGAREFVWKVDEKVVWPIADSFVAPDGDQPERRPDDARPWWRRYWPDLLLAAVLTVVAVLSRRHGLPTDGLWQDDAEPGAAGMKASLSQLILVGKDHPGYIAILQGWRELTSGGSDSLAAPAFIAGLLGPPLLYLGLRALDFARSIAFLLGSTLAAAQAHIINSGRVRSFTIDLLVVLGLAVVLPRLVRIKWTWITAVAWFVGATLVASISGFALGATLAAGAIVLLHRKSDLGVRALAVGTQVAATAVLFAGESRNYSSEKIETAYRELWDAFPDFHANPISFAGELLLHLRRLAEAFPSGPAWFAMLCGLVAIAGLAAASLSGRRAVAARFLALVLAATVVGSLFGKVPFGPEQTSPTNNGYRVDLWLIPVLAVGLGMALQVARSPFAVRRWLRISFDVAVFAAAAAILLSAGPAVRYPFPGAKSATKFIEGNLGPNDAVILPFHTEWSFAAESRFPVKLVASPEFTESFDPVGWSDPRIHYIDLDMDRSQVAAAVNGANRVFVYYPALQTDGLVPPETQTRSELTSMLRSLGLQLQDSVNYHDSNTAVDVLGRGNATASAPEGQLGQLKRTNLQESDLPRGWRLIAPSSTPAKRVFACIGVAPAGNPVDSVVSASRQGPGVQSAISELDRWQDRSAPRRAAAAISGPRGSACVRSTLEATFADQGYPLSVQVRHARPPAAAGPGAVAYTALARGTSGGAPIAQGSIVFAVRGRTSAFILGFRAENQPFPPQILSELTSAAARR
jgi:hypothetical protein